MSQLAANLSLGKSPNNSSSSSSDCPSNVQPNEEKNGMNYLSPTSMKLAAVGSAASASASASSHLSGTIDSQHQKSSLNAVALGSLISPEQVNSLFICSSSSSSSVDETTKKPSVEPEEREENAVNSMDFIQTDQRRIDHRRNKSEPIQSVDSPLPPQPKNDFVPPSNADDAADSTSTKGKSPPPPPSRLSVSRPANSSPLNKSKESKLIANNDRASFSSTNNKKKKNWFNPFQSSYRQRNEEFKKIFKDLPPEERLIVDYSCAWQKDILIQGRMYLSSHHLSFHANFLKWETSLVLNWEDIAAVTREKTAKVIPNAIEVRSNKGEKYFFASFATRDKTFAIISKLREAIHQEQSLSNEQFWLLIHENYGDDLDMTTDEDDPFHQRYSSNSTPKKSSPKLDSTKNPSDQSNCLSFNSIDSTSKTSSKDLKKDFDDRSSLSSRQDFDDDLSIQTNEPTSNRSATPLKYLSRCPCEKHLATQFIDRTYPMSVEHLFSCIFEQNEFVQQYRASRRIKDFQSDEWALNESTGKRERVCRYKVGVAAVFGTTTICSNERQTIECELTNSHYIIDTEVRNEGIKYADAFFVASRYCLVQISPTKSHLKVTCEVRYVKSLMIIIKSFIEKNATAALQDSYTDLSKRLEQECSNRTKSTNNSANFYEKEKSTTLTKRKHSRKISTNTTNSQSNERDDRLSQHSGTPDQPDPTVDSSLVSSPKKSSSFQQEYFLPFCLLTMFVLLSVNLFLCLKLNEIDRMTDHLVDTHPFLSGRFPSANDDDRWRMLLSKQEEFYQRKLVDLRSLLIETSSALRNVSQAFEDLSRFTIDSIKTNFSRNNSN